MKDKENIPGLIQKCFPEQVKNIIHVYGFELKFYMGDYYDEETERLRYFLVINNIWENVPRCEEVYK